MTTPTYRHITCVLYESRRFKLGPWTWRFRFVADNGEPLGHDYNDKRDALNAADLITNPAVLCDLEIHHRDGRIESNKAMR